MFDTEKKWEWECCSTLGHGKCEEKITAMYGSVVDQGKWMAGLPNLSVTSLKLPSVS